MALNVGELEATLNINAKGFNQGINQAKSEINSFTQSLGTGVKSATDKTDDAFDDATQAVKEYGEEIEKTGDKSGTASKEISEAGDSAEESGEQASTAKGLFNGFKSLLGTLGVGVGLTAITKWIEDFIDKLKEAKTDVQNLNATINYSTGASAEVLEELSDVAQSIAFDVPVQDYQDIGKALGSVATFWDGKADTTQIQQLTEDFLALKLIYSNMNLEQFISQTNDLFVKWNVPVEEQIDKLAELRQVQQNTGIELNSLISGMNELDDLQAYLGMEYSDVLGIVGGMESQSDFDDFIAGVGRLKSVYQDMLTEQEEALKGEGLSPSDAYDQASDYMTEFFKAVLDEAGSNEDLDKASSIISDKLGTSGKISITLGEMAQAMYNSDYVDLTGIKSNIEASKTNNGNWSDEQLGWKTENIQTTMNALNSINDYDSAVAQKTAEMAEQGYVFNPEFKAKTEIMSDSLSGISSALAEYSPELANLFSLGTLPIQFQTGIDNLISEIGKVDTSTIVNVNVETTDGFAKVTTSQQNAVANTNNPNLN